MPKKEPLQIDAMLQMMTGISLEEAVDVWLKEGDMAMQQALMEGAEKKRKQDDLMSPENMFRYKRPEEPKT
jgi:hypothetical protein